jgi:hypothetical protein
MATTPPTTIGEAMNSNTIVQAQHLNIPFPTECAELTNDWTEAEVWEQARQGLVTFDEADHMVDGYSLFESRIILAAYNCNCETCDI